MKKYLILISLFCSLLYAYETRSDLRVGVGGVYGLYKSDGEKDMKNTGGYLTLVGRDFSFNDRLFAQGGADFALGKAKRDGRSDDFSLFNWHVKIGFNPISQSNPLFINLVYAYDSFSTDLVAKDFALSTHSVGLDLQGFIRTQGKAHYEYNIGYYYTSGAYIVENAYANTKGYSYAIKGSLGFNYELSEKLAYFVNARVQYFNLAASKANDTLSYPKTSHLLGMLEFGIEFSFK
ncbi:hypothetical protein [Helicobacter marmotae]|uniref:Outer membrane beta-barrel protein n=1 Tax=Helicobacter marmotae TaxID=152490 RepID=A0A3D8I2K0_9HELI|nr:hypothetical protein [Helicobacter marmotae]RDU59328.1 hypothetical protein CQA63_07285 [Helicobacter marmotae]